MKRGSYVYNLVVSLGTRLLMIALRLLRNILLARVLGPADRGLFALLSTLPDLIGALTSGGLNTAIGYDAARQRPMGVLLTQVLIYGSLLAGILTLVGVTLMGRFFGDSEIARQLGPLAWLLLLAVPITVLKSGLLTLHNGDGRVDIYNALRLIESLAPLLLFIGIWLVWRDQALSAAVISWLVTTVLVTVTGWCWMARFHSVRLRWQASEQGKLLRYSVHSHPAVLAQQLLMRSDYLFVGALLEPAALGFYAMASSAAELLLIVPEAITTPLMKRLLQQGDDIKELTPLALRVTASLMFCACVCMALIGHWLIVTLFGQAFGPAYPALLALLPGLFCLCHASILRLDLLGKERPGMLSMIMVAGAVLNLVLNAVLIPQVGIVGAGVASSVSYFAVSIMMLVVYCRLSGVAWYRTVWLLPGDVRQLRGMMGPREAAI